MAKPLSFVFYLFLAAILASMATVVLDMDRVYVLGSMTSVALLGTLLMLLWLHALRDAVVESQRTLNREPAGTRLHIRNLSLLTSNQAEITSKFRRSAQLIEHLGNPDKSLFNELDSSDPIDDAIQKMRAEMERVKEEELKRSWVAQGLAKFGEVLRTKAEIKQYAASIISQLVKYLDVNQGGIYIEAKNDAGDRCLDLLSCYAYDKHKSAESSIALGAGLLGQCMLEHKLMFITDIPRDYARITSGLGESTPRNVIIAPLMFNNQFYGAIELIAFEPLEPHQIEFVREVSESIAAEIAALQSVVHTKRLLAESNVLAERLQGRESELQHHLETINATQQEMSRKQAELNGTIGAIDSTLATANFTIDGKLINANEIFLKVLGYEAQLVLDKPIDFFTGDDPSIKLMWENLKLGKFFSGEFKMHDHAGKEMWLAGTFNPIVVEGDVPERILMLAQFTTQEKEKLNELGGMVTALKTAFPVIEFNADFSCKTANEKAMKLFGLSRLQLRSKAIGDFLAPAFQQQWQICQQQLFASESGKFEVPLALPDRVAQFEVSISISKGLDGLITRIIVILIRCLDEPVSA